MSDTSAHPTPALALYPERQDIRQYIATNSCDAQAPVGGGPGRSSPGDLLKIAFAGYDAMSPGKRLVDRFGEDLERVVGISGEYFFDEDRFASFATKFIWDLSETDEEERARLLRRAEDAIERSYAIAHTLTNPVPYTKAFINESVGQD